MRMKFTPQKWGMRPCAIEDALCVANLYEYIADLIEADIDGALVMFNPLRYDWRRPWKIYDLVTCETTIDIPIENERVRDWLESGRYAADGYKGDKNLYNAMTEDTVSQYVYSLLVYAHERILFIANAAYKWRNR